MFRYYGYSSIEIRLVDIPNNYPESADYLNAPLFAMVIWILLPIYSLYVGITAKKIRTLYFHFF